MSADKSRIIDKIRKCLALTSSPNEHEAAAALRQAQKLMAAHGVSEQAVDASKASMASARATVKRTPATWEACLAKIIGNAFGCQPLFSSFTWGPAEWRFIGCGPAPEVAAYTMTVLLRQVRRARTEYIDSNLCRCKAATKTARADVYCLGWVASVGQLVTAFARPADHERAVQAYMAENTKPTGTLKDANRTERAKQSGHAWTDYTQGRISGESVQLNRGVGGADAQLQIAGETR